VIRFFRTPYFFKLILVRRIWGFSSSKNSVYLTFDDGPHPEITPWILNLLQKENIKATFFCVGDNVKKYPEILNQILSEGHRIGNHSMYHKNAFKTTKDDYLDSINLAEKYISSNLYRPPYGRLPYIWEAEILKKFKLVMWTWLSYDYDDKVSVNRILKKAKKIKSGDILVLHDNPKIKERQKILLPSLILLLKKKSFKFEIID
jgi:peptidoglycan/xylan/chitin deacetylase (PgdA/CDA1 family)